VALFAVISQFRRLASSRSQDVERLVTGPATGINADVDNDARA